MMPYYKCLSPHNAESGPTSTDKIKMFEASEASTIASNNLSSIEEMDIFINNFSVEGGYVFKVLYVTEGLTYNQYWAAGTMQSLTNLLPIDSNIVSVEYIAEIEKNFP